MRKVLLIKLIRPVWPLPGMSGVTVQLYPVIEPSPAVSGQARGLAGHPSLDGADPGQACTARHEIPSAIPGTLAMGRVP